jgi:hypothetical protein
VLLLLRPSARPLWLLPSAPPPSSSLPLDAHRPLQPQPYPKTQKYHLTTTSFHHLTPRAFASAFAFATWLLKPGTEKAVGLSERNTGPAGLGARRGTAVAPAAAQAKGNARTSRQRKDILFGHTKKERGPPWWVGGCSEAKKAGPKQVPFASPARPSFAPGGKNAVENNALTMCGAALAEITAELSPVDRPSLVKLLVSVQSAGPLPYTDSSSKPLSVYVLAKWQRKQKQKQSDTPAVSCKLQAEGGGAWAGVARVAAAAVHPVEAKAAQRIQKRNRHRCRPTKSKKKSPSTNTQHITNMRSKRGRSN